MMRDDELEPMDPGERATILWITWGALLVSLVIYAAVLPYAQVSPGEADPKTVSMLLKVFPFISLGEVAVIFYLRHLMYFERLEENAFATASEAGNGYFTISILSWALCESIAIYGFVVSMLGGEFLHYLAFAAPAAVLMIYLHPRVSEHVEAHFEESPEQASEPDGEW